MPVDIDRRRFLQSAAAAAAFTIVPRRVLGGAGYVAPSDKLTLGCIGLGTQGIREMMELLPSQDVRVVAVCDPNTDSTDYVDWSSDGLRSDIRTFLKNPDWRSGQSGIPGGREVGREIVETHYAAKGCASYADFRELLDKEKDLDAVKIMTPDHLHAAIAIAAMKKGKHVTMHKPLANRVDEARKVIATARQTKVATHFLPWDSRSSTGLVMSWINDGAIGALREIHNWSNRPMWPQYLTLPAERPPVPPGFDWNLWLGPALDRPFHPNYTHAQFRGWYDFGGGSIADMGHYSLWAVFRALDLGAPVSVEARPSFACAITADHVSRRIANDYSFPLASVIRFRFPAHASRGPLDLFWYDGGMRPPTPEELLDANQELAPEGMLFVGDKGKILAGFLIDNPRLLPESKMRSYQAPKPEAPPHPGWTLAPGLADWIAACHGGPASAGEFLHAGPISEAFNLAAVACRTGRRIQWDAEKMAVANDSAANKYLYREYRPGWEL